MARMLLVVGVVAACVALVSASCVKFCNHPNGQFGKYLCCDDGSHVAGGDCGGSLCGTGVGKLCQFLPGS
ncbi:hypothetical protein Pcinc_042273 [Petrolisthes cinctipes]|uniref:Uncharacterized protein n=1 Tax=Petrolisthes cinctipes TaxID=88211 RepID=A0AAE1BIN5_PETCI|nr:hypothetical protein Pcinc_042273 [Petrolisthes cinctipes]